MDCTPRRKCKIKKQKKKILFTYFHKINSLSSHKLDGEFPIQRLHRSGVGDGEAAKELVVLKDLHMPGDQFAQILADQVELIHIRFAGPQGFTLEYTWVLHL